MTLKAVVGWSLYLVGVLQPSVMNKTMTLPESTEEATFPLSSSSFSISRSSELGDAGSLRRAVAMVALTPLESIVCLLLVSGRHHPASGCCGCLCQCPTVGMRGFYVLNGFLTFPEKKIPLGK